MWKFRVQLIFLRVLLNYRGFTVREWSHLQGLHICFWPRINVTRWSSRWDLIWGCSHIHSPAGMKVKLVVFRKVGVSSRKVARSQPPQGISFAARMLWLPGGSDCGSSRALNSLMTGSYGRWRWWDEWKISFERFFGTISSTRIRWYVTWNLVFSGPCFGSYGVPLSKYPQDFNEPCVELVRCFMHFSIIVLYKVNH